MKGLSVTEITKSFGGQAVLRGVDLVVKEGSFTAILGPSGSGKTTLLRIIAGFERPDGGVVRLGDEVVDDASEHWVRCEKRRIGFVPQEGALFPHLSVGRNVAFGLSRTRRHGGRVGELLELVGLSGLERRYPHQLSGGQQQRVALARALAADPEIVLLDEPFSSLDASLRASVRGDVHDVLRLAGTTVVLVTHDQDEALSMADQVAVLQGGVISQIDTPASLYGLPRDAELARFLGEANVVTGMVQDGSVSTEFGELTMVTASAGPSAQEVLSLRGPAHVLIRPEQFQVEPYQEGLVAGVVRSYEYFGHDAVARIRAEGRETLPELVIRVTGGEPMVPGSRVGLSVRGPVVAWPVEANVEVESSK